MTGPNHSIDASGIAEALTMLERYVESDELGPLFDVLRELSKQPDDAELLARLSEVVNNLGVLQGAVLTYAPAIAGLLSDDPFSNDG